MPDDRLDELRRAWAGLEAPPPFRPLDAEDADTRRAVAWMRQAFAGLAPAPARVRRRPLRRALPLAAAAALLLGFALLRPPPAAAPAAAPAPIEVLASRPGRVELRSGQVRLTLLHPSHDPDTTNDARAPARPARPARTRG